uniref:Uncharacterized protein n=1 Tax=Meloidogyne incognita TaxID=6306 RepID=A0A914MHU7_MELIC
MSRITYITEIHHIDGDGKDAGVLYREMQPKEMDTDEIVNRERKELFYKAGSSYAVETGGRLKDIKIFISSFINTILKDSSIKPLIIYLLLLT